MHTGYHTEIGAAAELPIDEVKPIISASPIVIPVAGRPVDLELRVTVPIVGDALPIILLSHGHGHSNWLSSLEGYAPMYEFWAAHGFAVLQPTHLSSRFLGLEPAPMNEMFWQDRATDLVHVLDNLDLIEAAVPGLKGRLDRSRVAVAGHSLGARTAMLLLGATNTDSRDQSVWHKPETRIAAGIVLAGSGRRSHMKESAQQLLPSYDLDFSTMTTPTLVVYGDEDILPRFTDRGAEWLADSYHLSTGPKDLLTVKGAQHVLGGISGWDAKETGDESPERLAAVQRLTWAYFKSQLYEGDTTWAEACKALGRLAALGSVESKN